MRTILMIALILSGGYRCAAQTFDWWAHLVHWDGVSEWPKYMITQPKFMGPNALPVPQISNGSIDSVSSFGATSSFHFSAGDHTQNLKLYANYCLVKNVISIDASWIPYEHFSMTHATKEARHVFSYFYYDTHAIGDIILNTNIQILNKWRKTIQVAVRMGYRFPTGNELGAARYTDGPGYYFDLSAGKPFANSRFKWISMLGFYSWQMINLNRRQDDAFLFGTGIEWNGNQVRIQSYVAGYAGYINEGDKPLVARINIEKRTKRLKLIANVQQGLHDFKYTTVEAGVMFNLKI